LIVTVISVPSFSTNRTVSSVTDLYALKVRNNMPRGRVATQSYFHGSQAPTWTPEGPRLERQSCSPDAKGFAALSSASLRFLQKPATLIRVFQLTLSPQVLPISVRCLRFQLPLGAMSRESRASSRVWDLLPARISAIASAKRFFTSDRRRRFAEAPLPYRQSHRHVDCAYLLCGQVAPRDQDLRGANRACLPLMQEWRTDRRS